MNHLKMLQPEVFGLHWNDDYTDCFNHVETYRIRYSSWHIIFLFEHTEVVLHFSDERKLCSISSYAWKDMSSEEMPINDDRLLQWTEHYEKVVQQYVLVMGPPIFSGNPTNKEFFFYHSEARHITLWIQASIFMLAQDIDGWGSDLMVQMISTPRHDDETRIDPDTGCEVKSMLTCRA